jgi:hypothetical protein
MEQAMKRILVYAAIILAVVFSYCTVLFVFDQNHLDRTHVMLCEARQSALYKALKAYRADHGCVPPVLETPAKGGYVNEGTLGCSTKPLRTTDMPYSYFPENFASSHAIVLADVNAVHCKPPEMADAKLKVVTFGNGEMAYITATKPAGADHDSE